MSEPGDPKGRFRVIDGGISIGMVRRKYLLAQGSLMRRFCRGTLLVHGALSIHAAHSVQHFLNLMEECDFDGLVIDVGWGAGLEDAIRLFRTVRAIEQYAGDKGKPVVVCTTKNVGWRADALDDKVCVYELKENHDADIPQEFLDFLWAALTTAESGVSKI